MDIRHGLADDLYVNFAGSNNDDSALVEAYLVPLVSWLWIAAGVLLAGTLIALLSPRVREGEPL